MRVGICDLDRFGAQVGDPHGGFALAAIEPFKFSGGLKVVATSERTIAF